MKVLAVKKVSILYKVGDFRNIGLKEYVMRKLTHNYKVIDFWAVRNVSFTLEEGDFLGIIGTNGAGKSTLLKAISGVMEPTRGVIKHRGRIAALLELGAGFDGSLTVRENAYLRGAILGYSRQFMDKNIDSIIEFAGLQGYEDRMFRHLSSGMKARLAFSISSLVKPDILILDEVLAVGDATYRKKCEAKMKEIMEQGAVTILVSHSLPMVRKLSNKVLWLHKGRMVGFTDDVQGICDLYRAFTDGDRDALERAHELYGESLTQRR